MIFAKGHISDIRFSSQINGHRELEEDQRSGKWKSWNDILNEVTYPLSYFYLRSMVRKNPEMRSMTQGDFGNGDCGRSRLED